MCMAVKSLWDKYDFSLTRLIKPNRNAIIKMSNMKSYHLRLYLDLKYYVINYVRKSAK